MADNIPELYVRKGECCGCTACYAVCPKSAITMMPDEEGFDYPVIDGSKCIACFQCVKVCPVRNRSTEKENSSNQYQNP